MAEQWTLNGLLMVPSSTVRDAEIAAMRQRLAYLEALVERLKREHATELCQAQSAASSALTEEKNARDLCVRQTQAMDRIAALPEQEWAFFRALFSDPQDDLAVLAFADYLEEMRGDLEAKRIREVVTCPGTPIAAIHPSQRVLSVCLKHKITSIEGLAKCTSTFLLSEKKFGLLQLEEVRNKLAKWNLKLADDPARRGEVKGEGLDASKWIPTPEERENP